MSNNLILSSDSYKYSQSAVYPEGTEAMYSYIEPRVKGEVIVPLGLSVYIRDWLTTPITQADIDEAESMMIPHGEPFDRAMWEYLLEKYDGFLPITIRGIPEGLPVESSTGIVSVLCNDPKCASIASFIETGLQRAIWYPTTIASQGLKLYKSMKWFYDHYSDNPNNIGFSMNDFGARGVTSYESAQVGGLGHLVYFIGTDNVPALVAAKKYYNATGPIGYSVPASEHSVQCAYGKDNQPAYLKKMLDTYAKPGGIVSIVMDGYNIYREAGILCNEFKDQIVNSGAKVVFRPDCYGEGTQILTPDGWVDFNDITLDSYVAQVLDDGSYEFVKPLKVVNEQYDGDMIHFTDSKGKIDCLVTPNHRMVVNHKGTEKIIFAEDCKISYHTYSLSRSASGKSDPTKRLSDIDRLRIAFQADGSYVTRSSKRIRFSFSKQRKIDRLRDLLNRLGADYCVYELSCKKVEFSILYDADLFEKDFSWVDTTNLTKEWCQDFIDELSYWDSTRRSDSRIKFDTCVRRVINVVEIVAISAGYGCLISEFEDKRKPHFQNVFTANILTCGTIGGQAIEKRIVHYSGKIYCVTVPTGKILVKRNRATLVCGNSGDMFEVVPRLLKMQEDAFGFVVNSKGKKVINNVGIIQGDGITPTTAGMLMQRVVDLGYAPECVVLGSGGGLLQSVTRDTLKFAQKTSMMKINGLWIDTVKTPITDPGKTSKGGNQDTPEFVTYYHYGKVVYKPTWDEVRSNAMKYNRWFDHIV